tara:strand:+ start:913 stop:1404 length:492 start_codon:yes stop_codon:yes gene_type:complete
MKIATWNTISAGQIVKFRYKSEKTDKSYNRTVIVLDPIYRYLKKSTNRRIELLVGIEIDNDANPPLSPIKLKQLFKILGQERDEGEIKSMNETQVLQNIYEDLKRFLVGSPIFKTYLLRKCRKYRVFIEDKVEDLNELQANTIAKQVLSETGDIVPIDIGLGN